MAQRNIATMVMIEDEKTGRVLVKDRIKSWRGPAFPGGHVEPGESIVDCAVREVKEETGLTVQNLTLCGVAHWLNNRTFGRYLVFLYKTRTFSGTLIESDAEGPNRWVDIGALGQCGSSENSFLSYLPLFLDKGYSELFGSWNDDDEPVQMVLK